MYSSIIIIFHLQQHSRKVVIDAEKDHVVEELVENVQLLQNIMTLVQKSLIQTTF